MTPHAQSPSGLRLRGAGKGVGSGSDENIGSPATARVGVLTIGKLKNVKDPAVLLADLLESGAPGDLSRSGVIRIGGDLYDPKAKLRPRNFTCQRGRPGRHTAAPVSGIRPVGEICGAVSERPEFTASEKFTVGDAAHGEGKPRASDALLLPSSDDPLGVLEGRYEILWEPEACAVLGVTVGFTQDRRISRNEEIETDDTIAYLWPGGNMRIQ